MRRARGPGGALWLWFSGVRCLPRGGRGIQSQLLALDWLIGAQLSSACRDLNPVPHAQSICRRAAPLAPSPHRSPPASAGGASPAGSVWSYEGIVRSLAAPPRRILEAFTQRFSPQLQSGLAGSASSGSFRQAAGGLLSSSPRLSAGLHPSASAPIGMGQQSQLPTAFGGGAQSEADVEQQ